MLRWSWIKTPTEKRVYLDYAAATPVRPEILTLMNKVTKDNFANASAIHREGQTARDLVEAARLKLARCLKIRPEGVVFTGSGTESNNLAIYGVLRQLNKEGRAFSQMAIISTKLEHPSITEVLQHVSDLGVEVRYVGVNEEGIVDLRHLESLLDSKVVLVSVAYVNSEIGVVQDVSRIVRLVKKFNTAQATKILVHTDAAQAPLWLPCQFDGLRVDLMSLDAGKCYGPKGVGVLVRRYGVEIMPVILGGGQEGGLRAATENTPAIVGAVEALVLAQEGYEERSTAVTKLRNQAIDKLKTIDGLVVNGSVENRVANNINISIPGIDGEFAVVSLDEAGLAVSTKSACSGAGGGGSKVVEAISGDAARASSTIRITLGEETSASELNKFTKALNEHVTKTRKAQNYLQSKQTKAN